MIRRHVFRCALLAGLLVHASAGRSSGADGQAYDAEKVKQFAGSLLFEGEYRSAAVEYQRYFLCLADSQIAEKEYAWLRTIESYRLGGRIDLAIRQIDSLEVWPPCSDSTRCWAGIQRAICLHDEGNHAAALKVAERPGGSRCGGRRLEFNRAILSVGERIHLGMFRNASMIADSALAGGLVRDPRAGSLQRLGILARDASTLRPPDPHAAAALSILVPGLGKVYSRHKFEGVYAFVLNGLAVWQSIDGFHDDGKSSVKGWTAGAIGVLLYLGNIYGSADIAIREREAERKAFLRQVDQTMILGMQR
jgi:hypothetical protein